MPQETDPLLLPARLQGSRTSGHDILKSMLVLGVGISIGVLASSYGSYMSLESRRSKWKWKQPNGHQTDCTSKHFKDTSLKLTHNQAFANLFGTSRLQVYEASDVGGHADGDGIYTVFDNSYLISRNTQTLGNYSRKKVAKADELLEWGGEQTMESSFEFIAYNESSGTFVVGREAVQVDGSLHPQTFDVSFGDGTTNVGESCDVEFELTHDNKGFEGAAIVKGSSGRSFLLGLCEGNHCRGGGKGKQSGHGRIVVMERTYNEGKCIFKTVNIAHLPSEVDFEDYSAMALWNGSTIGITSQQNAALFVGEFSVGEDNIEVGSGRVYDFPRTDECEIEFCNVEGLHFLEAKLVVVVSDSMKKKQPFRCRRRDESIHVMAIP